MLGRRLNEVVNESLEGVDIVIMTFPANEKTGAGDEHILNIVKSSRAKKIAVVTKIDTVAKESLPVRLMEVGGLADWTEIIPVSAVKSLQVDILTQLLSKHLPEGPKLYPYDQKSDQSIEKLICEHIREAAIKGVREELPHSITVTSDEMAKRENKDFFDIHATNPLS